MKIWLSSPLLQYDRSVFLKSPPSVNRWNRFACQSTTSRPLYRVSESSVAVVRIHGHAALGDPRSEEHTSELQSRPHLVCRLLLVKNNKSGEAYTRERLESMLEFLTTMSGLFEEILRMHVGALKGVRKLRANVIILLGSDKKNVL